MLSELQVRKLTRFFQVLDRDGDGTISREDPDAVVRRLAETRGLAPGSARFDSFHAGFLAYWHDLMERSDGNRDGVVTLDEWLSYHDIILSDEDSYRYTVAFAAGVMFALMDVDEDGQISLAEYIEWIAAWDMMELGNFSEEMFDRLDRNGDGNLSQEEVLELMDEFFYSDDPNAPGNWAMGPF